MHNPASDLENETFKLIWDLDIQTDHLISARRLDLIVIDKTKKNCQIVDSAVSVDHRIKLKESEKKDKYHDLAREIKQFMEHEGDNYTNRDWYFLYSHQMIIKGTAGLGGRRTSGDHSNYDNIENGQNTEKSLGDLRRLAVTQTSVKDRQLKLMWKTLKE